MIYSKYNENTQILETQFEGEISIYEMSEYIVSIRQNKHIPPKLKVYSDASEARFAEKVTKNDLTKFLEKIKLSFHKKNLFMMHL